LICSLQINKSANGYLKCIPYTIIMDIDYNVLGVDKRDDDIIIKLAYKKKILECHPDRGGSGDEFIRIQESYRKIKESRENNEKKRKLFVDMTVFLSEILDIDKEYVDSIVSILF
jgi:DnaJ-class molecular chaperone